MTRTPPVPGRAALTKRAALAATLALHTLVIALLAAPRPSEPPALPSATVLAVYDAPAPPAPPVVPPLAEIVPAPVAAVPVIAVAADSAAVAGECAMVAAMTRALAADPAVAEALPRLPPQARSVADAVLLWNGTWSAQPALEPARVAVMRAARAEPSACLDEELRGPRLIPVGEPGRSTMLVVGSGAWRWRDLSDPA